MTQYNISQQVFWISSYAKFGDEGVIADEVIEKHENALGIRYKLLLLGWVNDASRLFPTREKAESHILFVNRNA